MLKVVKAQLLDVLPLEIGFIYAERTKLPTGEETVAFYVYDQDSERILPVKIKTYLEAKFGLQYREIARKIGNYLACDAAKLKSNGVTTLFNDGSISIFDSNGKVFFKDKLVYQNCPIRSLALDDNCFWCVVPDRNSVVKFSPVERKVVFRIGGGASVAFRRPVSIAKYDDKLFVCNESANMVKTVNLKDYSVRDYIQCKEPVKKYFRVGFVEYVVLESGIYSIDLSDKM